MFDKRLTGLCPESKKYIAGNILLQWLELICNTVMTWLIAKNLDGLYYCPHHPHKGYEGEVPELKIECECRKPRPGMLLKAAEDFKKASAFVTGTKVDTKAALHFTALNDKLYANQPIVEGFAYDRELKNYFYKPMIDSGLKKKDRRNKGTIDQIAATIMLQDYMRTINNKTHI